MKLGGKFCRPAEGPLARRVEVNRAEHIAEENRFERRLLLDVDSRQDGAIGVVENFGGHGSENETTKYMTFKTDKWYRIRVRVTDSLIQTWIDDQTIVYQRIKDRKISTRAEVDPSRPFGFATYETRAALRDIRIRDLTEEEIAE